MSEHSHYRTVSPVTGNFVKGFDSLSDSDVSSALDIAHDAYARHWRSLSVLERSKIVARAGSILREKKDEYAGLITLEIGKLTTQAYGEVELSAAILDYYASHAEAFLKPKVLAESPDCEVFTEPLGVLLAIEPWNFPYYQLARVAGPQLVAGNVVLCKHAPSVPQCALAFERLFTEAGAPPGVWTNIFATNDQCGMLIKDIRLQGVTLTGSERAGASIAAQAGRALKKVVLELGGSDPFVILEDADLKAAIPKAAEARLANMGQACAGGKRFIVVGKERGQRFLEGMKAIFESLQAGDPVDAKTTLGPVVTQRALDGLLGQVESARKAGATVVTGGKRVDRPGCYMEPTILTDVGEKNPLYLQEAFGPVATLFVVDTEAEAIRIANATTFGLGASVMSDNIEHAKKVATQIESGMVFINGGGITTPQAPFGGIKNSGFGRELSELGMQEFVNKKLIRVRG